MLRYVEQLLTDALAPVLRDLRRFGIAEPGLIEGDDGLDDPDIAAVRLLSADGSDMSVYVTRSDTAGDRVAAMADRVQEWVIEERWPDAPTNWPVCPNHPTSHPMAASTREHVGVWVCPADGTPFSPIGSLP